MHELLKKLQWKQGMKTAVVEPPEEFLPAFREIEKEAGIAAELSPGLECILVFVKTRDQIERWIKPAVASLVPDGLLWFAYPKKASKRYKSDITRDEGWKPAGDLGFRTVRSISVDNDWSALRLRHASHIHAGGKK